MREKIPHLLAVAMLLLSSGAAFAAPKKQPIFAPLVPLISLGNSAVPLTGPWKFSPGDSPWSMNRSVDSSDLLVKSPDWAQPAFDDSQWAAMDLTPPAGSTDPGVGTAGYLPGWTARDFPNLSEFAWYRLRIRVADPSLPISLKMPENFDDAYQVYVNGKYLGQFGQFDSSGVVPYFSRPASFPLLRPTQDGQLVIAIRFYLNPSTKFMAPEAGGMHQPPVLGTPSTIQLLVNAADDAILHSNAGNFIGALLFLIVAPLALWAWIENHRDFAWLWLFLALLFQLAAGIIATISSLTSDFTVAGTALWVGVILGPASWIFWILFWWQWFARGRQRWIPAATIVFGVLRMAAAFLVNSALLAPGLVAPENLHWFNAAGLVFQVVECILLLIVLLGGLESERTEALLAAPAILLLIFAGFTRFLISIYHVQLVQFPFGIGVSPFDIEQILMVFAIGAIAIRRFLRNRVSEELNRQALDQELEQAHELQQRVLIPEDIRSQSFAVDAEYLPAQIVGGDFYQTVLGIDGSLLVIIGDVSGKGVSAAMLVAVLVGAARTRAAENFDPASMLASLNQHLIGRSGGHFATCLVAQIRPNGLIRIASAGHIPPYLNGDEIDLDGSLPLGIAGSLFPAKKAFQLQPGDQLTFMTDGVVEAKNRRGELFGFDRARELSTASAQEIASEAQAFGQDDDITVLRVSFTGDRHDLPPGEFAVSGQSESVQWEG